MLLLHVSAPVGPLKGSLLQGNSLNLFAVKLVRVRSYNVMLPIKSFSETVDQLQSFTFLNIFIYPCKHVIGIFL